MSPKITSDTSKMFIDCFDRNHVKKISFKLRNRDRSIDAREKKMH